jgi:hypothetical protein
MKFVNSKGQAWYLHKKEILLGKQKTPHTNYYFKKTKEENSCQLPEHLIVVETKNGMPITKRR